MIHLSPTGMFAKFYDRCRLNRPINLCTLFWNTLGLVCAGVFLGSTFLLALLGVVLLILPGPSHWTLLFVMIYGLIGVAASIIAGIVWLEKSCTYHDSFIPQAWRDNYNTAMDGFRDKFCPLISYQPANKEQQ